MTDSHEDAGLFRVRGPAGHVCNLVPAPVSHILPRDRIHEAAGGTAAIMRQVVIGMPRPIIVAAILSVQPGVYLPRKDRVAGIMFDDGSILSWEAESDE